MIGDIVNDPALMPSSNLETLRQTIEVPLNAGPYRDEPLVEPELPATTDKITAALRANGGSVLRAMNAPAKQYIGVTAEDSGYYATIEPPQSVPEGFAAQVIKTVRERGNAYGTPAENHQTTADLISSWMSRRFKQTIVLTAEDVIVLNVIQKISRLANVSKDDSWLDIAGYTENVAMIRPDQRNGAVPAKRLDRVGQTYTGGPAADLEMGRI